MVLLQPGSHVCHLVQAVSGSARSFLGPHRSLKCVVDDDSPQDSAIVGDVQAYMHAVDGDRTATTVLLDGVQAQLRGSGSGGTWLVVWIGLLLQHLMDLIIDGVPPMHVKSGLSHAMDTCRKSFLAQRISIESLSTHPGAKAAALLYLEGCDRLLQGASRSAPAHFAQSIQRINLLQAQEMHSNNTSTSTSDSFSQPERLRNHLHPFSLQQPKNSLVQDQQPLKFQGHTVDFPLLAAPNCASPTVSSDLYASLKGAQQQDTDEDDEFAWFNEPEIDQSGGGVYCAGEGSKQQETQPHLEDIAVPVPRMQALSLNSTASVCGTSFSCSIDPSTIHDPLTMSDPTTGQSEQNPSCDPYAAEVECSLETAELSEGGEEDAFGWFFEEGALQAEREAQAQLRLLHSLARAGGHTLSRSSNTSTSTSSAGLLSSGNSRSADAAALPKSADRSIILDLPPQLSVASISQKTEQDIFHRPLFLQVAMAARALESGRPLEMQLAATALLALLAPYDSSSSSSSSRMSCAMQNLDSTESTTDNSTESADAALLASVNWARNVRVVGMLGPSRDSCAVVLGLCLPLDLLDPDPAQRVTEAVAHGIAGCTNILAPGSATTVPSAQQPSQSAQEWCTGTLLIESTFQLTQQPYSCAAQAVVVSASVKPVLHHPPANTHKSQLGKAIEAASLAGRLSSTQSMENLTTEGILHMLSGAGVGLVLCGGWVSQAAAAELWEGCSGKRVLVLGGLGVAFVRSCAEACGVEPLGGVEELVGMKQTEQQGLVGRLAVSLRSTGHGSDRGHTISPSIAATSPSAAGVGAGQRASSASARAQQAAIGAFNRDMMVLQPLVRDIMATASHTGQRRDEDGVEVGRFRRADCKNSPASTRSGQHGGSYTTSNAGLLGGDQGQQGSPRCSNVVTLLLASPFQHVIDTMTVTAQASFRKLVNAMQGWAAYGEGALELQAAHALRASKHNDSCPGRITVATLTVPIGTRTGLQEQLLGQQHEQLVAHAKRLLLHPNQVQSESFTGTRMLETATYDEPIWKRMNCELSEDREIYNAAVAGSVADALEEIVRIVRQNAGDSYADAVIATSRFHAVELRAVGGIEHQPTGMDDVQARCSALQISRSVVETLLSVDTEIFNTSE